jgi:hypothetical protein
MDYCIIYLTAYYELTHGNTSTDNMQGGKTQYTCLLSLCVESMFCIIDRRLLVLGYGIDWQDGISTDRNCEGPFCI